MAEEVQQEVRFLYRTKTQIKNPSAFASKIAMKKRERHLASFHHLFISHPNVDIVCRQGGMAGWSSAWGNELS